MSSEELFMSSEELFMSSEELVPISEFCVGRSMSANTVTGSVYSHMQWLKRGRGGIHKLVRRQRSG